MSAGLTDKATRPETIMLTNNTSLLMTCYQQQNKTQIGANIAPHLIQVSWVDSRINNRKVWDLDKRLTI